MTACRKAHHADPLRVDAPLPGFAADQTHGALRILKRATGGLALGLVRAARHAVLQDDTRHAERIDPGSHFLAFELPVKVPVAAARTDQHCGAAIVSLCRAIDRD